MRSEEASAEPGEAEEPQDEQPEPEMPPEPRTVPLAVFNAEGPCQASRAPEYGPRIVRDPYTAYADPGNRAGQVWHGDVLQATCRVANGVTATDESGMSSSTLYPVTTGGGATGRLPGVRTRDGAGVRVCAGDEV